MDKGKVLGGLGVLAFGLFGILLWYLGMPIPSAVWGAIAVDLALGLWMMISGLFTKPERQSSSSTQRQTPGASIDDFISLALQGQPADCRVKIAQFENLYRGLSAGFRSKGLSASEATDLLDTNLAANCPKCGMQMDGKYVGWLLTASAFGAYFGSGAVEVRRFSQGVCPNERCSSNEIALSWRP